MTDKWNLPKATTGLDSAFGPSRIADFLPDEADIPKEFWGETRWNKLVSRWFFSGLKGHFVAKDGIDKETAIGHLDAVLASFEPKHEHKEAGAAYLMSLWFDDFQEQP